jgi:hypothetical protein
VSARTAHRAPVPASAPLALLTGRCARGTRDTPREGCRQHRPRARPAGRGRARRW